VNVNGCTTIENASFLTLGSEEEVRKSRKEERAETGTNEIFKK